MNPKERQRLITPARPVTHRWPANMDPSDETEFAGEREYHTLDSYLRPLGRCAVSSDSVVYRNGVLLPETVVSTAQVPYYRYRHAVKKYFFSKRVKLDQNTRYLLATDAWSTGHFHWICDVLPALWSIRDLAKDHCLLLPDQPYIRRIGPESLEMLGIRFRDIVWMSHDAFYKVPQLDRLSPVVPSGHMHPGLMQAIRDRFRTGSAAGTNRIYISRKKAMYRKVLNEPALEALLKEHGFEVMIGEDHSFADQARIFGSASVLAGIHGAGLANAVFMPAGAHLIELRRKEHGTTNVGFWHLADALDQSFLYFNGEPDSDQPLVGQGCNLSIDLTAFGHQVLDRI